MLIRFKPYYASLPHNPKILWGYDAKIVGDRIAEVRPVPWNLFTQEPERRVRELSTCGVARVVGDVSVHEAPQPFNRIEMRTIGRDEMQFDPAPRPGKPFLHQFGMMIACVVEKDMDEHEQRIERLDRIQQPDC